MMLDAKASISRALALAARWRCAPAVGLRRRRRGPDRLRAPQLSPAARLSHPRHRRLEVPGRHRLERGRRAAGSSSPGSRRPRAAIAPTSASRPIGTGAKAAGVPHGAYHFVYWCRPPMEEMAFFEQNAPVEQDALPPVLDVEATPTSKTCHRHLTAGERRSADMQVMLEEMERHYGKRPIIYTTVDFYEAILAGGAFSDYPIWVRSTKYHPAVKYGVARLARSGNTSPTGRRRASAAMSTATSSTARRSNGTPFSASSPRGARGSRPYSRR